MAARSKDLSPADGAHRVPEHSVRIVVVANCVVADTRSDVAVEAPAGDAQCSRVEDAVASAAVVEDPAGCDEDDAV